MKNSSYAESKSFSIGKNSLDSAFYCFKFVIWTVIIMWSLSLQIYQPNQIFFKRFNCISPVKQFCKILLFCGSSSHCFHLLNHFNWIFSHIYTKSTIYDLRVIELHFCLLAAKISRFDHTFAIERNDCS